VGLGNDFPDGYRIGALGTVAAADGEFHLHRFHVVLVGAESGLFRIVEEIVDIETGDLVKIHASSAPIDAVGEEGWAIGVFSYEDRPDAVVPHGGIGLFFEGKRLRDADILPPLSIEKRLIRLEPKKGGSVGGDLFKRHPLAGAEPENPRKILSGATLVRVRSEGGWIFVLGGGLLRRATEKRGRQQRGYCDRGFAHRLSPPHPGGGPSIRGSFLMGCCRSRTI
jgi:hypothetical protein